MKMIEAILIINSIFCILVFISLLLSNWDKDYYKVKIDEIMYRFDEMNNWTLAKEKELRELRVNNKLLNMEIWRLKELLYEASKKRF